MRIKAGLFLPLGAVAALLLFPLGGVVADTFISGHRMFIDRVDDRGVSDGEILKYDGDVNQWVHAADDTGVGGIATNDTASAVLIGTGSGWAQETDATIDSSGNISGVIGTFSGSVFGAGNGFQITSGTELMRSPAHVGTDTQWRIRHRTDGAMDGRLAIQCYDASAGFGHQYQLLPTGELITPDAVTVNGTLTLKADSFIYDNKYFAFGSGADIQFEYVTGTPDRLHLGDGTDAFLTVEDAGATGVFVLTGTLTTSGLLTATTGVTIPDDQTLTMGDVTIVYDEATDDRLEIAGAVDISGAATLGSTLDVTGLASLDGGIDVDGTLTVDGSTGVLTTSALANLDGGFKIDTDKLVVTDAGVITSQAGITALGLVLGTTENFSVTAAGVLTADALANLDGGIAVDTNKFTVSAGGDVGVDGDLSVGGTFDSTGETTVGRLVLTDTDIEIQTAGIIIEDGDANPLFTIDDDADVGDVGVTGDLGVAGDVSTATLSTTGNVTFGNASTDTVTFTSRLILRQTATSPMTTVAGTEGELVYNTTDNKVYVCQGGSGPWTWAALH